MMRSLPQTLLFVLALIVANCQCVLTCFGEPTQAASNQETSEVPAPCHSHSPDKDDSAPETCAHARVVAEHRAPSTSAQTFAPLPHDAVAVIQRTHFFLSALTEQTERYTTAPAPSPELARSTVLRV